METGHNSEDVVAEETERSTVERREAAKGAARLGVWVRVGSIQSLGGSPGPVGMMESREGTPGVLSAQGKFSVGPLDKI